MENGDLDTKNTILNSINSQIQINPNNLLGFNSLDLYRAHMHDGSYHWGSNLVKANLGTLNLQLNKYNIRPDLSVSFAQKASEQLHYFHGVNPNSLMQLSNMYDFGGDHCINEIYHGWFADGTIYDHAVNSPNGPAPGFLIGGANQSYSDDSSCPPYGQPAQKSILDFNTDWPIPSWEITEPAIYYQAAYIRLLAAYSESVNNPLPTTFLNFNLKADGDDAILDWQTNNEVNIDKYEIERSFDFTSWEKIEEIVAKNSSGVNDYNFIDEGILLDAPGSKVIYRIKIVEQDQTFSYSDTNSLDIGYSFGFEIYPNPTSNEIKIIFDNLINQETHILIYNALGQIVDRLEVSKNQNQMDYSFSNLANGWYLILLNNGIESATKKVFKG